MDLIVAGLGTMGSAAAAELARRGHSVLGLEQFSIPNSRASHHGHSRMFRMAYFEHPDYVPLLKRAFTLWQQLESDSGQKLFHVTGGIYIGRPDCDTVARSAQSARAHGLDHRLLSNAQLRAEYPQFRVPDDFAALYEPTAGFVIPELAVEAMAAQARRHGADLHANEPVLDWSSDSRGVTVRTPIAEYRADKLILACGAWSERTVRGLGVPLRVTRQNLFWVTPPKPDNFALGRFPVWAIESPDPDGTTTHHYGFPLDSRGLKLALHRPGRPTDPDNLTRTPLPGDDDEFRPALALYMPDANGPLATHIVCMYTNSPDSHFIIDRHPGFERVTLACGFSGHGFKFAPVIGEILADLATDGRTALPAQFLGLARFHRR